jgi:hypothetical protein
MMPSSKPALSSSADPVSAFLEATLSLTALVDDENARLGHERPASLADLVEEKQRRALAYSHAAKTVQSTPGLMAAAAPALRNALAQALQAFDAALLRNGQLIMRAKQLQEGLLGAIAAAVNNTPNATPHYGANGAVAAGAVRAGPIALNATV